MIINTCEMKKINEPLQQMTPSAARTEMLLLLLPASWLWSRNQIEVFLFQAEDHLSYLRCDLIWGGGEGKGRNGVYGM